MTTNDIKTLISSDELYYGIGQYISDNTRNKTWGTGAINAISSQLQKEMPGLRGFSASALKRMRTFYEQWCDIINRPLPVGDLKEHDNPINIKALIIRPLIVGEFKPIYLGQLSAYLRILDSEVKKPHENPSIGIVLCKTAHKAFVEFLLDGYNSPMGVAIYKTPEEIKRLLPSEEELTQLLNESESPKSKEKVKMT